MTGTGVLGRAGRSDVQLAVEGTEVTSALAAVDRHELLQLTSALADLSTPSGVRAPAGRPGAGCWVATRRCSAAARWPPGLSAGRGRAGMQRDRSAGRPAVEAPQTRPRPPTDTGRLAAPHRRENLFRELTGRDG